MLLSGENTALGSDIKRKGLGLRACFLFNLASEGKNMDWLCYALTGVSFLTPQGDTFLRRVFSIPHFGAGSSQAA